MIKNAEEKRNNVIKDWNSGLGRQEIADKYGYKDPASVNKQISFWRKKGYNVKMWNDKSRTKYNSVLVDWNNTKIAIREIVMKHGFANEDDLRDYVDYLAIRGYEAIERTEEKCEAIPVEVYYDYGWADRAREHCKRLQRGFSRS